MTPQIPRNAEHQYRTLTTLANFHNATLSTRYLCDVDNLCWVDSVYVLNGNIDVLPCTPFENPVSRWKPQPDLNATTCTNSFAPKPTRSSSTPLKRPNRGYPHHKGTGWKAWHCGSWPMLSECGIGALHSSGSGESCEGFAHEL